jgi:hypothetical protein
MFQTLTNTRRNWFNLIFSVVIKKQDLHFHYTKTFHNFRQDAFPIWLHFHYRPYSVSLSLLKVQSFLAVEDYISSFNWIVSRMYLTNFARYEVFKCLSFLCPLAAAGVWCWETEISIRHCSKNLNEGVLQNYREPVKFSSVSVVIARSNSLAISYKFQMLLTQLC